MPDTDLTPLSRPTLAMSRICSYVMRTRMHPLCFRGPGRAAGQGYRIWYDEGIDPGNEWPVEIAKALTGATYFVVFISPQAVDSINVRDEINFALNHHKPLLAVHLVETALPPGLELRMGDIQAIMKFRMSCENYWSKLLKTLPDTLQNSESPQEEPINTSSIEVPLPEPPRNTQPDKASSPRPKLIPKAIGKRAWAVAVLLVVAFTLWMVFSHNQQEGVQETAAELPELTSGLSLSPNQYLRPRASSRDRPKEAQDASEQERRHRADPDPGRRVPRW